VPLVITPEKVVENAPAVALPMVSAIAAPELVTKPLPARDRMVDVLALRSRAARGRNGQVGRTGKGGIDPELQETGVDGGRAVVGVGSAELQRAVNRP